MNFKLLLVIVAGIIILFHIGNLAGRGTLTPYFPHYAPKYIDPGLDQGWAEYNYGGTIQ